MWSEEHVLEMSWQTTPYPVLAGTNNFSTTSQPVSFQFGILIKEVQTYLTCRDTTNLAKSAVGQMAFTFPLFKGLALQAPSMQYLNVPCWSDRHTSHKSELYVPAGTTFGVVGTGNLSATPGNPYYVAFYCSIIYQKKLWEHAIDFGT